jgi:hypothetical protein
MTPSQLTREIIHLKAKAIMMIKNSAPVRTGNLQNSIFVRDLPDGGFEVYIDGNKAPYAIYTLEEWTHPRWNGKQNPNEGWAYEATKDFIKYAQTRLKGVSK